MVKELDGIDRAIVRALQDDGSKTNVELAQAVGLTEGAVRRRVALLRRTGLVSISATVDPLALGLRTHAVIGLHVDLNRVEALAEQLADMRELSYVYQTAGQYDIMIVGFFASDEQLRLFLTRKLARLEGILRTDTFHILRTMKRSLRWGESMDANDLDTAAITGLADRTRPAGRRPGS